RGKDYTMQQMARFSEEPDRATRQEAWELATRRRLVDREKAGELFDKILPLREQIARNADFKDYRAYTWKALKRFDYTPKDCIRFNDTIAKTREPLADEVGLERAADLGVAKLRPWDMSVDPQNRPPLRPFPDTDIDSFV